MRMNWIVYSRNYWLASNKWIGIDGGSARARTDVLSIIQIDKLKSNYIKHITIDIVVMDAHSCFGCMDTFDEANIFNRL